MSDSLWPHGLQPTSLLCPWGFPGENTGVGSHSLLQGIFPDPGLNLSLLHWQVDPLPLSNQWSNWIVNSKLQLRLSSFSWIVLFQGKANVDNTCISGSKEVWIWWLTLKMHLFLVFLFSLCISSWWGFALLERMKVGINIDLRFQSLKINYQYSQSLGMIAFGWFNLVLNWAQWGENVTLSCL